LETVNSSTKLVNETSLFLYKLLVHIFIKRTMSKNKKLLQVNFFKNSYFTPDPWFKKLYYKINGLVKEGKSKEEILGHKN